MQALVKDEIGDGAVGCLGGVRPGNVAGKVGRFAFQD